MFLDIRNTWLDSDAAGPTCTPVRSLQYIKLWNGTSVNNPWDLRNIPELQIWYRQSRAARGVPRRATCGPDNTGRHMLAPSCAGRHLSAPTSVPSVPTENRHSVASRHARLPTSVLDRQCRRWQSRLPSRRSDTTIKVPNGNRF
jgi:hypothetical protein